VNGPCDGLTLKAVALADGKEVASAETPADWRNNRLVLNLSDKRLWSIEAPFLYDLKFVLLRDGQAVDQVDSYFGLREVTIHGAAILINGKPVFQRTVLDQGFYPDGIWTAPSDEALRNDIKLSQAVGFNGARLLLHPVDRRRARAERRVYVRPQAEIRREAAACDPIASGGLREESTGHTAAVVSQFVENYCSVSHRLMDW
jgi:hypothetical protein